MKPKRLARTVIYENPWVNVYVDKVQFPDGRIVEQHHLLDFEKAAVAVLVENDQDQILLVHAYRYTTDTIEWEVPAGRLDDLVRVEELPRPIVAKLDTQGAELRVLRGAERSLPHIDHLICEFWPHGLRRMGDSAEDLIELFRGFSYGTILRLDELPERLPPADRLCARLDWLPSDGSDQGFYDVLVTRHAELPSFKRSRRSAPT